MHDVRVKCDVCLLICCAMAAGGVAEALVALHAVIRWKYWKALRAEKLKASDDSRYMRSNFLGALHLRR